MREKVFPLLAIIIMVLFGACSNEEILLDTNPETNSIVGRTISLTASMPIEPTTRVGLEQKKDSSISLTWETSDEIQLAFAQGENKFKSTAKVTDISEDGKNAKFNIDIPDGIELGEKFDLYGVYGGGKRKFVLVVGVPGSTESGDLNTIYAYDGDSLSDEIPTDVILPSNPSSATSLEDLKTRKDVMIYFKTEINASVKSQPSVIFRHLGSLFNITLKNTSKTKTLDLHEARLIGVNGDGDWAYNINAGGQVYDLVSGKYQETTSRGNYISFSAKQENLQPLDSITFWGWYPPLPDKKWPELKLELIDKDAAKTISVNSLPARTTPVEAGKCYYIHSEWDGTNLKLNDNSFDEHRLSNLKVIRTERVGAPIMNMEISASSIAKNKAGDNIFYGVTSSTVFGYNLDTDKLVDEITITKSSGLDVGNDGVINIPSKSFYRYNTITKKFRNYGSIAPETAVMHKGCFDSNGNYYFGTYPNAALFKYDVSRDRLTKIGVNILPGNYIRSMASCGDLIFMGGLGSPDNPAKIKVYNAKTGQVSDVPDPIWPEKGVVQGEHKMYYSMSSAGKYLYARFSAFTANVSYVQGVYDSEQGKWTDFLLGTVHLHSTDIDDEGLSYFRAEGTHGRNTFISYNPKTKEKVNYDGLDSYSGYYINPKTLKLKNQSKFPGKTVVFGARSNGIALFNLQNQKMTFVKTPLPQEVFSMRTIRGGYNNDIIASSYASDKLVIYDALNKVPRIELPLTQMEGLNVFDGKYYLGAYGNNASIREVDPQTARVSRLADMAGFNQDRAFVVENADEYIIWGTIPNYGYRGGAVGIYNKSTKRKMVYANFIPNQSITGLAYKDGFIYGTTTMWPGLGIEPIVTVSKIFKMDVNTGKIVKQVDVSLSTDTKPQYFAGGMIINEAGRLFMACSQTLVEIDKQSLEIKNEMRIGSYTIPVSTIRWQPFALEWRSDGLLFTNIGNVISAVDVDTWRSKKISTYKTNMITLGSDNNLYYISDSNNYISRLALSNP